MSMNKYFNKKVIIDGIKFDSKKEAGEYLWLKMLEKKGDISNLELQPKFELQPKYKVGKRTRRAITYTPDFSYYDKDGQFHVVDVKGYKTDVYKIKKKLFEYKFKVELEETVFEREANPKKLLDILKEVLDNG